MVTNNMRDAERLLSTLAVLDNLCQWSAAQTGKVYFCLSLGNVITKVIHFLLSSYKESYYRRNEIQIFLNQGRRKTSSHSQEIEPFKKLCNDTFAFKFVKTFSQYQLLSKMEILLCLLHPARISESHAKVMPDHGPEVYIYQFTQYFQLTLKRHRNFSIKSILVPVFPQTVKYAP